MNMYILYTRISSSIHLYRWICKLKQVTVDKRCVGIFWGGRAGAGGRGARNGNKNKGHCRKSGWGKLKNKSKV